MTMNTSNLPLQDLEARLTEAEAIIAALRRGEVDAIFTEHTVMLLRLREVEDALLQARRDLEQRVVERTAALQRANVYNRRLIEASLDPLVTIGPDGKIQDVNTATEHATGYPRAELIGADFSDYFTEPERARAGYQQVFRDELVRDYALELRHRDGHVISVLYNATVYRDDAGQILGVLASARDITDRKRAEEQLQQHAHLLEEAVQQKQREMETLFEKLMRQEKLATIGQMAGSIAHELRNPLGAVKNAVYYLKRLALKGQLDAAQVKVREFLDLMERELNSSERVIADVLQMTRLKPPKRKPTNMRPLIEEAAQRCHLPAAIRLAIVCEPEPLLVSGDAQQLRQVFENLLTNAAQAIEGEGAITISARQTAAPQEAIIEIHDTGVGIAPEAIPKVFDPLYTTKVAGSGLGLPICKEIIENHQGRISLTSQAGQGTTVTIALPQNTAGSLR